MRVPELATAAAFMALSAYFMWHASALPIGWVDGAGPGGGAFPFWLSAAMFLCGAAIAAKEARRVAPRGWRPAPFIHPSARGQLAAAAGGFAAMVALTMVLGVYVAVPLFLVLFIHYHGHRSWTLSLSLALGSVLFMFFFFEVTLKILLPKGYTEPLFYPLYAIFF